MNIGVNSVNIFQIKTNKVKKELSRLDIFQNFQINLCLFFKVMYALQEMC